MSPEIWLALIAASPGLLALIVQWVKQRKENTKVEAEAADVITKAAKSAVELQGAQVARLDAEILTCKKRIALLERWVQLLSEQIQALDHAPVTLQMVEDRIAEGIDAPLSIG